MKIQFSSLREIISWVEIQANHVAPEIIITAPTANNSVYSGSPVALLTEGTAKHGTMMYAPGNNDTTAPNDDAYVESIPTGTDIATYYVWYKATRDKIHVASEPVCVAATQALSAPLTPQQYLPAYR